MTRTWAWIWLVVLIVVLILCAWLWQELTTCREDLADCRDQLGDGPPTGGPIIDITIGGGGNASYRVDNQPAPQSSGTVLDRRFFSKLDRIHLINPTGPQTWVVPDVKVNFISGSRVEGIPDAGNQNKLVWTCYDAGNNPTKLTPGAAGVGVPPCMSQQVSGGAFGYNVGGQAVTGTWLHVDTNQ